MINKFNSLLQGSLILGFAISANASPSTSSIPHTNSHLVIDGQLDEELWQHATKVQFNNEFFPSDNVESQYTTTAYIIENGNSLLVGFEAFDPHPEEIRGQYKKRDSIGSDDKVGFILDTFNSERVAYEFYLNSYGVQLEKFRNDIRGKHLISWDTIWNGAAKKSKTGYTAEFEIPFSSVRFPSTEGKQTWGIEFTRHVPRDSNIWLSSEPKERGNNCFLCQIPKYEGFKGIKSGSDFQIVPSLAATRADSREKATAENPQLGEWNNSSIDPEVGLDVRWGITDDTVLNLTLNPDFSQVEADADQISVNSTFSPSQPERRDFFLEGIDYFSTSRTRLVHTRNIVAPDYGLKITGKIDDHSYAALVANDTSTNFLLPSAEGSKQESIKDINSNDVGSDNFVVRYSNDFGRQSNVGFLVSNRQAGAYQNRVTSIDGVYKPNRRHNLSYQWSYSDTNNPDDLVSKYAENDSYQVKADQKGSAYDVRYQYLQPNYDLRARYINFGEDFRADMSSIGRTGYSKYIIGGGYSWYGDSGNPWTKWGVYGDWDETTDYKGQILGNELEAYLWANGPMQSYVRFGVISRESFKETKSDSPHYIGIEHNFFDFYTRITPIKSLAFWAKLRAGQSIDVKNVQPADMSKFEVGSHWRFGDHLTGTTKYVYEEMDVDEGRLYDVNQFDFRFIVQFDLANSLKVVYKRSDLSQEAELYKYNTVDDEKLTSATQLVYAYEPNPKTVCFIGYSHSDDMRYQESKLTESSSENRKFFMKLSYAFQS